MHKKCHLWSKFAEIAGIKTRFVGHCTNNIKCFKCTKDISTGCSDWQKMVITVLKNTFKEQKHGNYIIMPLYPFDPLEEVLSERDELYSDLNNNNS